jgi:hypothetical protein
MSILGGIWAPVPAALTVCWCMPHVKITGPQDIDTASFTKLVKAAVKLNRTDGDPTKAPR